MLGGSAAAAKTVACSIMNPQLIWESQEDSVRLIDSSGRGVTQLRRV